MTSLGQLFDSYGRQARLYPALLTLLPALVLVIACYPALLVGGIGAALITLATTCGVIFFLADVARAQGRRVEQALLREWGGWPTSAWKHTSDCAHPRSLSQV